MAKFRSHLELARRTSEADFQRALTRAAGGPMSGTSGGPLQVFGGNASGMARINAEGRGLEYDAQEQLGHYRNQVFTSIRTIANRIAGQPIRLAKIAAKPKGRQREIETRQYELPKWVNSLTVGMKANEGFQVIDQHPILDSLSRPAPSLPGWNDWSLKYATVASLELTGYGYWWMPVVSGKREVWAIPPSWLRPNNDDGRLFDGWWMRFQGCGQEVPIPLEEVAAFWYPDPANPIRALGPLEAGAKSVLVEEFVIEAQKRSMQLGVHPSALITLGSVKTGENGRPIAPRLKKWQLEQAIQAVNARYKGMAHYGEPMFLDALIADMKPYGNKPSEMDFGTNADSARARVEQIFNVNPYSSVAAGLSSRAESAEADRHLVSNCVNPKIELLSRVMTIMVLPQFDSSGQYVLFIEPARANDAEMQSKDWDQALKYGTATVNEHRTHVLRLSPVPGGDVALVPTAMQYVKIGDTVPKPLPAGGTISPSQPVSQTPGTDAEDPDEQGEQEAEGQQSEGGEQANKSLRLANKSFDDAFYDNYADAWLKSHGDHETSMGDAVLAFFELQAADVANKLDAILGDVLGDSKSFPATRKASVDGILPHVFEPAHWTAKFKSAIKPAFAASLAAGATHELESFSDWKPATDRKPATGKAASMGFDFGVDLPADVLQGIQRALDEALAKDYWADIQDTTRDLLSKSLADGLEAGEDIRAITKRVKADVFGGDVAKERARTIARSETTNALNAGQHEARLQLADEGVVEGKEWFATFDGRTRGSHLDANGQQRSVDEPFDVGGHAAKYPGDPSLPAKQRANCRCLASSVSVFTKRTRRPRVKAYSTRGCEIHGRAA